jgi:hypothetical protein
MFGMSVTFRGVLCGVRFTLPYMRGLWVNIWLIFLPQTGMLPAVAVQLRIELAPERRHASGTSEVVGLFIYRNLPVTYAAQHDGSPDRFFAVRADLFDELRSFIIKPVLTHRAVSGTATVIGHCLYLLPAV